MPFGDDIDDYIVVFIFRKFHHTEVEITARVKWRAAFAQAQYEKWPEKVC